MPNAVSSLPSPDLPIRHASDMDGAPDTAELSFSEFFEKVEENLTFADFIDVINPLQHIPVISTIYRMITGDEISLGARLAGGALYGGAAGVAAASLVAAFEGVTGETVETQVASLFDDTSDTPGQTTGETAAPAQQLAKAPTGEAASGADPGRTNTDKAPQIAAAFSIPENPGRSGADQQVAALAVKTIDYTDAEIDQDFFPSSIAPEPNNPEYLARQLSAIMPAAGPTTEAAPQARQSAIVAEPRDNPAPQASVTNTDAAVNNRRADERARIAQSIADAQRAQAGMLLASLGVNRGVEALYTGARDDRDDLESARASKDPFLAHPYALPQGASSAMIAKAMERALGRYQQGLQQGYPGMTSAAPRGIPLAVR